MLELRADTQSLLVRAGVGWHEGVVGNAVLGADHDSPAGYALRTGEPVVCEDLTREERFIVPPLLREHGVLSAVNVIIRGEGEPFGVLEVDGSERRSFSTDDINFMQGCANLVATAVDRLVAQGNLARALEEKQVLLHELQHRVKNNLQEISALVNLEQRKASDAAARRLLEVLGSRLEALSLVYRKLYLVNHHTEVDLAGFLAELCTQLRAFHSGDTPEIDQALELHPLRVVLDQALPLGLIACEFIVNSFKHAFPAGRGRISISLELINDGEARMTLADDGVGAADGNLREGSGLILIKRLVEQVGGDVSITSERGVTVAVSFPAVAG